MTAFMDQKWKDLVQEKLEKATTVAEMNKIMAEEMDVIWPKYKRRKLYFQSKQEKSDDLEFIAEVKSKAEFSELLELVSKN